MAGWPACQAGCSSAEAPVDPIFEHPPGREKRHAKRRMTPGDPRQMPPTRLRALGYSQSMFDVLVYLYENYWRPDACPDHAQLSRKLSAVGFESDEIQEALHWLDGLAMRTGELSAEAPTGATPLAQSPAGIRVYLREEQELLGDESIGFISFLEAAGVLTPPLREMVIDRATAVGSGPLELDDLKIIVLMVFWSLGEEPDALILDELFVAPEDRLIH